MILPKLSSHATSIEATDRPVPPLVGDAFALLPPAPSPTCYVCLLDASSCTYSF